MSLKAFHVFFISVSILLTILFGMWEIHAYTEDGTGNLWMAAGSLATTVGLIFYLRWFLKKLSRERYL